MVERPSDGSRKLPPTSMRAISSSGSRAGQVLAPALGRAPPSLLVAPEAGGVCGPMPLPPELRHLRRRTAHSGRCSSRRQPARCADCWRCPRAHAYFVAAAVAARHQGSRGRGYGCHQATSQLLTHRDRPSCQTSHRLPSTWHLIGPPFLQVQVVACLVQAEEFGNHQGGLHGCHVRCFQGHALLLKNCWASARDWFSPTSRRSTRCSPGCAHLRSAPASPRARPTRSGRCRCRTAGSTP